jgi:hypothetical protein
VNSAIVANALPGTVADAAKSTTPIATAKNDLFDIRALSPTASGFDYEMRIVSMK